MAESHPADQANALQQAIIAMKPALRRSQIFGALGVLITAGLAISAAIWVGNNARGEAFKGVLMALGIGVAIIVGIAFAVRRTHEITLMPILAKTVGLYHTKGGRDFTRTLPTRLLPRYPIGADDVLSGKVEGRQMQFAEIKVETGGKNSTVLFDGLVIRFPLSVELPEFFIADQKETEKRFLAGPKIKVDDLVYSRSTKGPSGRTYGLWSSSRKAIAENRLILILNTISTLENELSGGAALYTASCNGKEIHLAVRHKRDLFRIGGLFAGEAQLSLDIMAALSELNLPIRLVGELIEAERGYIALGELPPEPDSGRANDPTPDQIPDQKDDRDVEGGIDW